MTVSSSPVCWATPSSMCRRPSEWLYASGGAVGGGDAADFELDSVEIEAVEAVVKGVKVCATLPADALVVEVELTSRRTCLMSATRSRGYMWLVARKRKQPIACARFVFAKCTTGELCIKQVVFVAHLAPLTSSIYHIDYRPLRRRIVAQTNE